MKKISHILLATVFLMTLSPFVQASEPFSAKCTSKSNMGYRNATYMDKAEWTKNENFIVGGAWDINFDGNSAFTVDGKEGVIVGKSENIVTAYTFHENGIYQSLFSYQVNFPLKMIVVTEVNSHSDAFGNGIKMRAIELDCKFSK